LFLNLKLNFKKITAPVMSMERAELKDHVVLVHANSLIH